ncbi:MAG: nucleotide exchange factor GrpE [Caldilineaceae bacterium]
MSTPGPRDGTETQADATLLQIQNRLLQLAAQVDRIQTQMDGLHTGAETNSQQVTTLVRHFTDGQAMQPVHSQLADLANALDATQEQLTVLGHSLATVAQREQLEQLQRAVMNVTRHDALEQLVTQVAKQGQLERLIEVVASQSQLDELSDNLKKLTRTQFKANTLVESKEQQVEGALATLREMVARREQAQTQQQLHDGQRLDALRSEARGELAAELLPALDSIELALANGTELLQRQQTKSDALLAQPAPPPVRYAPAPAPSLWQRLLGQAPAEHVFPPPAITGPSQQAMQELVGGMQDAFAAWLRGLELVADRFGALLASEDVHPIEALQQPFNPKLHVAVEMEVRSDVEPNTVVRVVRKGYQQQERVLRYAEVIVARALAAPESTTESTTAQNG